MCVCVCVCSCSTLSCSCSLYHETSGCSFRVGCLVPFHFNPLVPGYKPTLLAVCTHHCCTRAGMMAGVSMATVRSSTLSIYVALRALEVSEDMECERTTGTTGDNSLPLPPSPFPSPLHSAPLLQGSQKRLDATVVLWRRHPLCTFHGVYVSLSKPHPPAHYTVVCI